MTIRKTIKRATASAAHAAMNKHIEKMAAKGWTVIEQFAGDEFLQYEVIAHFAKPPAWAACATRRNVDGKPDYPWIRCYTNGAPVLYRTEEAAYAAAVSACAESMHGLHSPRASIIESKE
jgi:hypothetical protein